MIKLDNVFVKNGEVEIFNNLNYSFQAGINYAIIGPSGSGKSTFLDLLSQKLFPTSGEIIFDQNLKIDAVPFDFQFNRMVQHSIQFYQQRFNSTHATISPTVLELFQNQIKPVGTFNINSVKIHVPQFELFEIETITKQLKINHLLHQNVTSLSNGETKRLLIAFSLLKKPNVILFDNPFDGLSVEGRFELNEILTDISVSQQVCILMVCQPNNIPPFINKVVEISKEKIEERTLKKVKEVETNKEIKSNDFGFISNLKSPNLDFEFAVKMPAVNIFYGEKHILKNINFEVKKLEKILLKGPNGSGKSTLLSLITADNPQGYLNDYQLFDIKRGTGESIWEIKSKIGFVSPELHLFFPKYLNVYNTVASGYFDTMGVFKKMSIEQTDYLDFILENFGLTPIKTRRLDQLSKGEQRMVLLARAIIKSPPLLLLDEPCQGLDYRQMSWFRRLVSELVNQLQLTLIYVSHYDEEAPTCIERIVEIYNGEIVQLK